MWTIIFIYFILCMTSLTNIMMGLFSVFPPISLVGLFLQGIRRVRQINIPRQIAAYYACETSKRNSWENRVWIKLLNPVALLIKMNFMTQISNLLIIYFLFAYLHISPFTSLNGSRSDLGQDKKSLKQRREEQRKASEAGGDTRAWNSLFIRPDTVCSALILKL